MDWLAAYSPMQVDWRHKWLIIPYGDSHVQLQGHLDALPAGSVIQVAALLSSDDEDSPTLLLPAVSALLEEFQDVFAPPVGYPPAQPCDHDIPLLAGATPVQVRPYRYPPAVKDEIERQVSDMLQHGLI